mmetsp:Transcript_13143/g.16378  ORF Transcript_13143/g.16378 Transcript_13143/m.16378 type:complete len:271 (+) Transcript_13143:232-1044(+)
MKLFNASGVVIFSHDLGEAASATQLQRMVGAFLVFCTIYSASRQFAATFMPTQWKQMEAHTRFKIGTQVTSIFHSVFITSCCLHLAYVRTDPSIEEDHMYGFSDRANLIFAVSSAFFLWDTMVLFAPQQKSMQYEFLLHHVLSMICYILVQQPFLQYHSIRMLLMELSSPFLAVRTILLNVGKTENNLYKAVEAMFLLSFIAARILYAIPVSALAMYETYHAYINGLIHTNFACGYIVCANLAANSLNLLWTSKIYKMATRVAVSSKKEI